MGIEVSKYYEIFFGENFILHIAVKHIWGKFKNMAKFATFRLKYLAQKCFRETV